MTPQGRARSWDERRSRFNHDWLLNDFLTFVQAWRGEFDQAGESGTSRPEVGAQLGAWQRRRPELDALIADAVEALSPASALDADLPPTLSGDAREEVRRAAHDEWLEQSDINERLQRLRECADAVDTLVRSLLAGGRLAKAGTRLYEAGCKLSDALSALRTPTA